MTRRARVADEATGVRFVATAIEGIALSEERRLVGRRRRVLPAWRSWIGTGGSPESVHRESTLVSVPGVVAVVLPGETTTWRPRTPPAAWVLEVTRG